MGLVDLLVCLLVGVVWLHFCGLLFCLALMFGCVYFLLLDVCILIGFWLNVCLAVVLVLCLVSGGFVVVAGGCCWFGLVV